jgi:hypothetical protein
MSAWQQYDHWQRIEDPLVNARNLTRALRMMYRDLDDLNEFARDALCTVTDNLLSSIETVQKMWMELVPEVPAGTPPPSAKRKSSSLTVVDGDKSA